VRRAVASLLLAALAAGCGDEPAKPKPPPQHATKPEPVELDLPPIGQTNNEADTDPALNAPLPELEEDDYLSLPAPEKAEPLRWDFGDGKRHTYEFSQSTDQTISSKDGDKHSVTRSHGRNRGVFDFVAWKDGLGKLHIQIATVESSVNGKEIPREQIAQLKPTRFECTLKGDGTLTAPPKRLSETGDARVFLDALLPILPGEKKATDGFARTKITGYFKVDRYACARLETEFDYRPATKTAKSVLRGRTVGYFAYQEGFLVRVKSAVSYAARAQVPGEDNAPTTHATNLRTTFQLKLINKR
jgi:hypothetical protein